MATKNPYKVIVSEHVTEKSVTLQNLATADSNACVRACKTPKYVFRVAPDASKGDIKEALEEIYKDQHIRVTKVNTLNVKRKRRRVRGRVGYRPGYKKAVVSLEEGDQIEKV